MKTRHNYETITQALDELKNMGYDIDFNIDHEFDELATDADNYVIDYLYRYEGESNPSDESSVYGIKNKSSGRMGVFVAGNLSFLEGRKRQIILDLELKSKKLEN